MDIGDSNGEDINPFGGGGGDEKKKPRPLPDDLPKSLNDRRRPVELVPETEMYDGWQGNALSRTAPSLALSIAKNMWQQGNRSF